MSLRRHVPACRGNRSFTAVILGALLGVAAMPQRAEASACARIDTNRDNLTEQERQAATLLLTQALEKSGQAVVLSGCDQTYVVSHVKLGTSVSITLAGPQGYRQATAHGIEDLPNWYDQMVRSLLSGAPMSASGMGVTRDNVAVTQVVPNRVEADSLWYVRLGYGMTFGGDLRKGPALGFGYRYELDNLGIDFSFLNFMVDSNNDNNNASGSLGVTATWIRLQAIYFFNSMANGSTYLGGGLGWGAAASYKSETDSAGITTISAFSGSGLEGQLTGGYEFLRASTIRMFAQADLTLPFYMAHADIYGTTSTESHYLPSLTFSLGIGWGRGTARVRVIQ
jgi:hypothetical protein